MNLPVLTTLRSASPAFASDPRSIGSVRVLRISLTDRCNFRCTYCMPEDGVAWLPSETILSANQILQICKAAVQEHGISRFKLTGGEPTLRRDLLEIVRSLRDLHGVEDISLTTNGFALHKLAVPLKDAGLDRVTVSLDSLRPERFRAITRSGDLATVLSGLDAAEAAGLRGLKVNVVAMRGTNDDEYAEFARLTLSRKLSIRFIEYMPLGDSAALASGNPFEQATDDRGNVIYHTGPAQGCGGQLRGDVFVSETEIRQQIEVQLGTLLEVPRPSEPGVGPAVMFRLPEAIGRIGFISAMSAPFCSTCNRLRLTADGVLRSCLFDGGEVATRPLFAAYTSSALQRHLAEAMTDCVTHKPLVHSMHGNTQMSRLGG